MSVTFFDLYPYEKINQELRNTFRHNIINIIDPGPAFSWHPLC